MKIGDTFTYEPPLGWEEARKKASLIYRRVDHELALSVWPVKEGGSVEELMKTALTAFESDLKNPNLRVAVPLERVEENGLEFWVQSLGTRDGTVLFNSAAVRGKAGVMVATMETPNTPAGFPLFVEFLRSVKAVEI